MGDIASLSFQNKFGQGFTILVKLNTRGMAMAESVDISTRLKTFLYKQVSML
jgi:hypothetical protein